MIVLIEILIGIGLITLVPIFAFRKALTILFNGLPVKILLLPMAMPNRLAVVFYSLFGFICLLNFEKYFLSSQYWLILTIPIVFIDIKNHYNELSKELPLPADVYYFIELIKGYFRGD